MEVLAALAVFAGICISIVWTEYLLDRDKPKRKRKRKNDEWPDIPVPEVEPFLKPADEVYVPKPATTQAAQKPALEQYGPYVEWARQHRWTGTSGVYGGYYDPNWMRITGVPNYPKHPSQPPNPSGKQ